jgi:hypothetical protein
MELNFSELDNLQTQNPYQNLNYNESQLNTPDKYWDNYQEPNQATKKKKVSFDDILSNMNLVVNQKGVLQFMQPNPVQNDDFYSQPYQQQSYQQQSYQQQPYQEYVAQQMVKKPHQNSQQGNQVPIDPAIKNSFLYNKYFKDYKEAITDEPQIRVPKTMEEYKQMLIQDKIKQLQQKKRIAEIKSTKLLFTTNNNTNHNVIHGSRNNNLRNMGFH